MQSQSRHRELGMALLIPSLAVLLAATVVECWRVVAPTNGVAGDRTYQSLGDAIAMNDLRGAYAFIRLGQNPNALIPVHDPALTGGREVLVPPLVWAAAGGRMSIVLMLLGAGATFEQDLDRAAPCIADRLGFADVAATLRAIGRLPPASACPPAPAGPPLVAASASASR